MKAFEKYLKQCKEVMLEFKAKGIYNPCYISGYQSFNPSRCFLTIPTKGSFEISKKTAMAMIPFFDHEGGLSERYNFNIEKLENHEI